MNRATRNFVQAARVGRLGTVGPGGSPHVVPVCFVLEGDAIYIALDEKPKRVAPERLRRVRNLLANPRVQLLIDRYDDDWTHLAFVQVTGCASLLNPGDAGHNDAVAALRRKYPQYLKMRLEQLPVICIEIDRETAWGEV